MVRPFLLFPLFLFTCLNGVAAQSGCPGCQIDLPPLPADTIFLGTAPDGVAGEYYDGDLSFRMPKTTTPVNAQDPGTPAGLNISKITIVSLLNVPPGLSWEPSQFEFDPDNETDGCVKFCGTPLLPGFYEIEVFVTAEVSLITESTSFSFPMYIAPASSNTDGFSMQNSSGCGEVTVNFENNIPSNGLDGYSYVWDFGNGTTSDDEQPAAVTYSQPGQYEVHYEASIDTFGFELTTIQVLAAGCDDTAIPPIFSGAPDLYIKIKDPSGNQIFSTDPVTNSPIPSAYNVNMMLGDGLYELEVRDDDLIGSDHCGTVTFDRFTNDTLEDGDLKVFINIIHPVFIIQSTDTVYVYEIPAPPVVSPEGLIEICEGETTELIADYPENLQWYRDSAALLNETGQLLTIDETGIYWVTYTSPEGCSSQSDPVEINIHPPPAVPSFFANGNLLELTSPGQLPLDYSLQWSINSEPVPGATDITYCNMTPGANLFTLTVTDNETGCSNAFSIGIAFDPDYNCDISASELEMLDRSLVLFPNPAGDWLNVTFSGTANTSFSIGIFDGQGRRLLEKQQLSHGGEIREILDLQDLAAGIYLLRISSAHGAVSRRFIRQ